MVARQGAFIGIDMNDKDRPGRTDQQLGTAVRSVHRPGHDGGAFRGLSTCGHDRPGGAGAHGAPLHGSADRAGRSSVSRLSNSPQGSYGSAASAVLLPSSWAFHSWVSRVLLAGSLWAN